MDWNSVRQYYNRFGALPLFLKGCGKTKTMIMDTARSAPGIDDICFTASVDVLQEYQREEEDIEDILNTVYQYQGFGHYRTIEPLQIRWELRELLLRVQDIKPENIVEIGTAEGGTFYVWARAFPSVKELVSVDLPGGIHGGGYPATKTKFYKKFNQDLNTVFIRGNSHQDATKHRILEEIEGNVDFLFIDGDHRYKGVKRDFELYSELVRDGGIIALHDIVDHPFDPHCSVDKFWEEVVAEYNTEEIISNPGTQKWGGIGIVYL